MAGGSYRRLLRWGAAGAALATCAAVLSASSVLPPQPPAAAPSTVPPAARTVAVVRVLQMNLCDSGVAGCYTGRSVAEAGTVIHAARPDVVTLNEVCRGDVTALERSLATAGGGTVVSAFQAAWNRDTGAAYRCRNGQPYGIGLVARLVPVPGGYGPSGGVYPMQYTGSPEERAWLCLSPTLPTPTGAPGGVPTGAPAGAVAVCTTHLTNADPAMARAQCAYLLRAAIPAVRSRGGAVPLVLGGDLNLRSGGTPDVGSCVPAGDGRADDGVVQHVVATPEFVVGERRTIGMHATDHPALLVTLTLERSRATAAPVDHTLAEPG